MSIHDWTRLEPGDFHHFHQAWVVNLTNALNGGLLPPEYMAMTEQVTGRPIPDVVTLQTRTPANDSGGIAVETAPPTARVVARLEKVNYAKRADRVAIRHGRGKVVAIIEIVSPGNKDSRNALRTFVEKAADILNQGVNLLVVDLFPPTSRDPHGIHKAIWDEFGDEPFAAPPSKPLIVASYIGGDLPTAYVESIGVGDALPSLPIFLSATRYLPAPLEATYLQSWATFPALLKDLIDPAAR
ncbi:DUF4058 family protein [Fimbriiglobus ruber]|uniref:DUF4058 domain-containing protein n=1 Tax=Fimbriiglobus ruber TaxID=1908690 RepID=A0A225DMM1_9BACT|nr:DUF4058 family protein [Fimbriiglobus ruber]OWK37665.1 hypothetical protein FRUB_06785 [Fimbriiglobus ruber]